MKPVIAVTMGDAAGIGIGSHPRFFDLSVIPYSTAIAQRIYFEHAGYP